MPTHFRQLALALAVGVPCLLAGATAARAWDDHALGSMVVLQAMPEARAAAVRVETLGAFLAAEKDALGPVLGELDAWARGRLDGYPAAPALGAWKSAAAAPGSSPGSSPALAPAFAEALRLNPHYAFTPLAQRLAPEVDGLGPRLTAAEASLVPGLPALTRGFVRLTPGESVPAWLVAATASDEPDYGPDLGLFSDNGTDQGARSGFGPQPFGNPQYAFSSASPFHMGFYHEAKILYAAAPFLRQCYPELRLKQYLTLARLAFRSGHPYWGWRFTGFGLHYVQDLTQPYHASVFPGMSTVRLLWVNAEDLLGFHRPEEALIQIVNNRHLALENYVYSRLEAWLAAPGSDAPAVVKALVDGSRDGDYGPWADADARDVVTAEAYAAGPGVDAALTRYLPEALVSDPDYIFGKTNPAVDVARILAEGPPEADARVAAAASDRSRAVGTHSRRYLRAALAGP